MIDLSIIIISYNVEALLSACLDSMIASPVAINKSDTGKPIVEIIVVDSASSDNSVSMVREKYPQVKLFAYEENIGFVKGNNIGFEAAQGRYLLMLNPDTEVIGDAIPQMIAYLDANPDVGIVGSHTLNSDGSHQSTRRRFPTKTLAFFESTWLQSFAPQQMLDNYYVEEKPNEGVYEVDWVQGSALMARRAVYDKIGGLDTGYVMYSEEMDWCKRAKDSGWKVVYLGTATIIHHLGQSSEQVGAHKHIWFQQSKIRYFRKHHGAVFATILRLFLIVNYLFQLLIEGTKGLIGHKREIRRERVRAYWQVIRSGLKG
ncbi:MAG: glycosyltransferase family 2 protein [Anaerolineae bacterium]|nr:glycosyltransferase family 2 protein [Anaerolineae bacterium]